MFSSLSSSFLWRGLLAIVVGVIAIVWPGVTILAVVVIFAILAFGDAFVQGARAFSSDLIGPVVGHLLLALIDLAAGVVALAWPGITAWVLTIWIGAWAIVTGVIELVMALQSSEAAGERALYGLGGLLSILLGVVLFARPHLGAVALAEVFGLFSLVYGATSLVLAARTRATGDALSHALS
jgi:uncharacterized membrane protein HdeD (DUF308 family)